MRRFAFAFALVLVPSTAFIACSDDSSDDGSSDNGSGASSASSTGPGPGSGGSGNEGGSGASGATGGTGSGGESSGGNGSGGSVAGDHLLISELGPSPVKGEFIEIHNPTAAAVDLSDYYLSDNSTYYEIGDGQPFDPVTTNAGTDFLARFPAGTTIPAGGFTLVAVNIAFQEQFPAICPNFILSDTPLTCAQGTAAAMDMIPPVESGAPITLSDNREMVVLFTWDGTVGNAVKDVDYLTWGTEFEDGTRVDKTGVSGYQADTAPASQKGAPLPPDTQSIERCPQGAESGETTTGGNGIDGHDETSEDFGASFKIQAMRTPGAANGCN